MLKSSQVQMKSKDMEVARQKKKFKVTRDDVTDKTMRTSLPRGKNKLPPLSSGMSMANSESVAMISETPNDTANSRTIEREM